MADENNTGNQPDKGQQNNQPNDQQDNKPDNSGNGQNSQADNANEHPSMIEEARKVAEELKKQNQLMAENLKKAEKMQVENLMGGRTQAGKEPTQDDKVVAFARNMLKGTGYEDELFPQGGQ